MSYRVLIVDDEPLARERLKRFLLDDTNFDSVGEAGDGLAALDWLRSSSADIVLLDIRMPGLDGLATAEKISALPAAPVVIFCTAYDEHALAAFRVDAVDYLLKPIRREDLGQALGRAANRLSAARVSAAEEGNRSHISARTHSGIKRIAVADILWFSADQKYVTAHYNEQDTVREVLIDETLKYLEEALAGQFIRIHRSILVATEAIDQLHTAADGAVLTLAGTKEELPVSRRHVAGVRRFIKGG